MRPASMFMKPAMITETDLYRLLTWLSPAFPIGSFSYSHGIEYAIEEGLVGDANDLGHWIDAIIRHGGGRIDALILCQTWRAVTENDTDAFNWAVERGATMRGTSEMALESAAQGQAFLSTVRNVWLEPKLDYWADLLIADGRIPSYPVAVGLASVVAGIPLPATVLGFLHASAANLVSAGVRLIPLGQTDGQRVIAGLEPMIRRAAETALAGSCEDIGSATPMIDWTSARHESQHTRLFRS